MSYNRIKMAKGQTCKTCSRECDYTINGLCVRCDWLVAIQRANPTKRTNIENYVKNS